MPVPRRVWLWAAAVATMAAATPASGQAPGLLPDLVSDPPEGPRFARVADQDDQSPDDTRLLLRFDGAVHNVGDGPLDLQGDPRQPGGVRQYLSTVPASDPGRATNRLTAPTLWVPVIGRAPRVGFAAGLGHGHPHLLDAVEYSLWDEARSTQITAVRAGMCLEDTEPDPLDLGPDLAVYAGAGVCAGTDAAATTMRGGVSEGYRAVEDWNHDDQWIDVSDVPPGRYVLGARVDPADVIAERREDDNGVALMAGTVTIPGYRAQPVSVTTGPRITKTFSLASQRFEPTVPVGTAPPPGYAAPGEVRYRVETLPASGQLLRGATVVAAGTTLPAGVTQLTYVPNATFTGPDSFAFSALNIVDGAPSRYPRRPAEALATVLVTTAGVTVAIGGAPPTLEVGARAQLTATVAGSDAGVTWTVDGVPGGTAATGRISAGGLYTAPSEVPPSGRVSIQAIANADSGVRSAPADIVIVPSRVPTTVGVLGLAAPRVRVAGRRVSVEVTAPVSGRLSVTVLLGGLRVGGCVRAAGAGELARCEVRMALPYDPGSLTVHAVFTGPDGALDRSVAGGASRFRAVSAGRRRGAVVVRVRPLAAAEVRVRVLRLGREAGRCTVSVRAGRTAACRLTVVRGPARVVVSVRERGGRTVAWASNLR